VVRLREQTEKDEERRLSPWACLAGRSQGRVYEEEPHTYRTAFQRDRDRILHSTAFRRLQYKTQVFVYHEGDHFRNRLTHTLEVAQIARTIARALGVNEDLTEAIVLAHDLGHTPFGHSGERVLNRLLEQHGGFEHNRQSLRIVDFLEVRSDRYRGLNLSYETRAGLLKHGADFPRYPHPVPLPKLRGWPSIEAQIANASDEIAYHTHDIDDGLRSGLLEWDELSELELWRRALERSANGAREDRRTLRPGAIIGMIDLLATDLIEATAARLGERGGASGDDVCEATEAMVGFSAQMSRPVLELAAFLRTHMYRHHRVVRMALKAERILQDLWTAYLQDPRQLSPQLLEGRDDEPQARVIADYLAGMTDRFALEEHRKLFDPHAHV
jgi:dGTPase